ncbi:hypothetical protein HWV07_08705 [Natronomonas salina]|uniref:hypothetical protein n=1 Tax=Natronomonas salina TaxID=1710540 RepID=UPI0015B6C479|nr:hypothetical protein [Natronomonas salina]QLD89104.1 hypothetical protein HWV07_08705 [Natronomonas salina]
MSGLLHEATTSEQDILRATKALLRKIFGDIDEEINGIQDVRARSKHGVANVIEEGYFGISINNSQNPTSKRLELN